MDTKTAKQIGQRLAMKSALLGLLIAYILFALLTYRFGENLSKAIFWIFDVEFGYNLLVGAIGLLGMAYFFGQFAGVKILIKRRNEIWTGIMYGLITLLTGTVIGSSVGFVQEGMGSNRGFSDPIYDYYFKPLYWVTLFGLVPVIIVGFWFGRQIRKQGQKVEMSADSGR